MDNTFIKDAPLIKSVEIAKDVLNNFEKGNKEKGNLETAILMQSIQLEEKIKEKKTALNKLLKDKEELQSLIVGGNVGLTGALVDLQKEIKKAENDLKESMDDLNSVQELANEQRYNIEKSLYEKYIDSGDLKEEYYKNVDALQIQYYSLLYKAFEVAQEMQNLSDEYYNAVNHKFPNYKPYKDFTTAFSYIDKISKVKSNFPNELSHKNVFCVSDLEDFIDRLEATKKDKSYILYK